MIELTDRTHPKPRLALAAGGLAGLAVWGYFIFLFCVPALALFAVHRWRNSHSLYGLLVAFSVGFAGGCTLYAAGFLGMIFELGGWDPFWEYISAAMTGLNINQSRLPIMERVSLFYKMITSTLQGSGPAFLILREAGSTFELSNVKLCILFLLPSIGLVTALRYNGPQSRGLWLMSGFVLGNAVLFVTFGSRLWLHHSSAMLPVFYVAMAIALDRFVSIVKPWADRRIVRTVTLLSLLPIYATNMINAQDMFMRLEVTGGVGLASDAINRYSTDSLKDPDTYRFFPDWGVFMPFAMLTRGSIPYSMDFSIIPAKQKLCSGTDIEVVLVAMQPQDRLGRWTEELGIGAPEETIYRQRNGIDVLRVARWRSNLATRETCAK